jgi:hypothetical protein
VSGDLPPYSGCCAGCPKCGQPGVTTTYHAAAMTPVLGTNPRRAVWVCGVDELTQHLCRLCMNCGYGWCEATVDSVPASGQGSGT